MFNNNIKIQKKWNGKIPYLTEILPEIPTNTILYKRLTGLGATYGELKAQRHSIIIEPNKPVISGKCTDPKHCNDNLFGVFEGVHSDDIVKYLERSAKQGNYFKILTTPESFRKVQDAFEEIEIDIRNFCFLLFDECHKIIKDVNYRADISLPMDFFFQCRYKALVSATPIEFTDPRFEEQDFHSITIVPDFNCTKEINLHTTNNLLQTTKQVLNEMKDADTPFFLFCNSTDTIHALMQQLGVLNESAVFCSDKSVKKLNKRGFCNVDDVWKPKLMKRYNWLTSRFYNAVDIELAQQPIVLLLTDCYFAEYTTFDPHTDAIQCVGRFRNGVSSIHHIANTNHNFAIRSRDELKGYIDCSEAIYNQLDSLYQYSTTPAARDAYREAMECVPFAKFLNSDRTKNYFYIDNYVNDALVHGFYNNPETLCNAYAEEYTVNHTLYSYAIGDHERLKRNKEGQSIKEKRMEIVAQLELLGECVTELEMEYKRELVNADEFIVTAYDIIGKAEIERLNYNRKRINEAMILAKYHERTTGVEVRTLMQNSFEIGKWYTKKYIKAEINRIFGIFNIAPRKAVTSHTILDFFEAIPCERRRDGKKLKGYLIQRVR